MRRLVIDIEADGLIEDATKIHCLCYHDIDTGETGDLVDYMDMRRLLANNSFFEGGLTLIGHKIITYDIPMLEKFLGCDLSEARQVDTLGLSQYLFPKRLIHGLGSWGKNMGIEKPEVEIWKDDGTPEFTAKMIHRCSEDVKINVAVFNFELEYLAKIYKNRGDISRIINYISFKLKCIREQEEVKMKVDIEKCKINLAKLEGEASKKIDILKSIMPRVNIYKIKSKPKIFTIKDGSISKLGLEWLEFLKEKGLPEYHNGAVKYIADTKEPNPTSHDQLKEWCFKLGWVPETFKYVRKKVGGVTDYSQPAKKIPQLASDDDTGLCRSVKALFKIEPRLIELESLFITNHRIGILSGFLEHIDNKGFIKAEVSGFTNTLRFTHKKPITNLPQIPKKYWKEVRECLIAPDDDHVLCGSDMSGLEDQTKRHYMYFYDPEFVKEMMSPDFDPHLAIAIKAGLVTEKEAIWYKAYEAKKEKEKNNFKPSLEDRTEYGRLKGIRLKAKKTNFAAIYGAMPPKIAVTANIPIPLATTFYTAYWIVNWSIKKIVENTIYQTVNNQMWLWNPVAQLWYSLKATKDIFSTLNQGTGAYAFDTWVRYCRMEGYKICMQYHDEHVSPRLKGDEEKTKKILLNAIEKTNEELKLNITLGISIDFGNSYADIH